MIVYKYTNLLNGKVYIGITTKTLQVRHKQHLKSLRDGTYFHNAITKYGIENFSLEIIDKAESKEDLMKLERHYIEYYNSFAYLENSQGYNCTIGGDGMTGQYGELNHCYGQPFKERVSKEKYDAWLEKINNPSDETRKKISEAWKGNKYFLGKKHTEENKRRMSELKQGRIALNRLKVNQFSLDGLLVASYDSILHASKAVGAKSSAGICDCCKGKRKTANGHIWKYVKEN